VRTAILATGMLVVGLLLGFLGGVVASAVLDSPEQAQSPQTVTVERTVEIPAIQDQASASPSASATASASASALNLTADKECQVGQPCDLGNEHELTIDAIKTTQILHSEYGSPRQGHFVVVDYTYTYNGSRAVEGEDYPWVVEDDEGRSYLYDFDATNEYVDEPKVGVYPEFRPGIPAQGRVIFEVAPDSKGMSLLVTDPVLPQGAAVAELKV
jgi:hypothetical protein